MPDIYLPNIIKLELTNFSLYCEQSVVMDFSKPVSCLMGANGIGKSTLLNCVNFAITGRINPTNKKLKSIDTLDRGNNYYLQYFDGRISEVDKDYASTRIVFMLGNKRIEVVRNFFPDNSILEYKLDNETQDPRNYEDDVVRLANLNNYAQFVFLQLKVLTFDESRDCLFWNPSILTPTIFLCLGESVDNAERADELAREIQKVNSRIRNVQWEISKQSARLTTLIEEKSKTEEARPHYASEDEASAQNEYEEIIKELEEGESYHQGYTKERQQIYARITELTVEKVRLRKEYEEHYAELYAGNGHLYRNPIIMALTSDGCPICHTAHQKLPEHIEQALNQNVCPLCGEHMEEVEFLCAKGYLSKDSSGYYRISDTASLNSILSISKSGILGWRSKYIEVVFDSLLTKSFPRVVRAVQNEPGISLLESINRTSTLLESSLINALYEDFGVLKEIIGDPQIDLVVPASLWIDYLSVQKQ